MNPIVRGLLLFSRPEDSCLGDSHSQVDTHDEFAPFTSCCQFNRCQLGIFSYNSLSAAATILSISRSFSGDTR